MLDSRLDILCRALALPVTRRRGLFGAIAALGAAIASAETVGAACLNIGARCGGRNSKPCARCCSGRSRKKGDHRVCACIPTEAEDRGNPSLCCSGISRGGVCKATFCTEIGRECASAGQCCTDAGPNVTCAPQGGPGGNVCCLPNNSPTSGFGKCCSFAFNPDTDTCCGASGNPDEGTPATTCCSGQSFDGQCCVQSGQGCASGMLCCNGTTCAGGPNARC